jgi:hypothetical protein
MGALIYAIIASSIARPNDVSLEWIINFAEPDSLNQMLDIAIDSSGNVYTSGVIGYYVQGANDSIPRISQKYEILKYDSLGSLQWRTGAENVAVNFGAGAKLLINTSGELIVMSSLHRTGTELDFSLVKYSANGTELWTSFYNHYAMDHAGDYCMDESNNFYVIGKSRGDATKDDIAIVKIDDSGKLKWVRRIDGPTYSWDSAGDIAIDDSANIYFTGFISGSGTRRDIITAKYDSSGRKKWQTTFNSSANSDDWGSDIALDKSRNVFVFGVSYDGNSSQRYILIKYNHLGIEKWRRFFGEPGLSSQAGGLVLDNLGNIFISGISYNSDKNTDIVTIKYDTDGNQLWLVRYNGPDNHYDIFRNIEIDQKNNIYIAGRSYSNKTYYDFLLLKYNSNGVEQWSKTYNGNKNDYDYASKLKLDRYNNIYFIGTTNGKSGTMTTLKYSQSANTSISEYQTINPNLIFSQNYPNPFNNSTTITYSIPEKGFVDLSIYNLNGRKRETLINEEQGAGEYQIKFEGNELSSGMYFYRLRYNGYSISRKLLLVR